LYGTGIGLAAAYIEEHLRTWGANRQATTDPTARWFESSVVRTTSHATVTVSVAGETWSYVDATA
jgi:hypothetical protein